MIGMENLIPRWLHKEGEYEMSDIPPPPETAIVPKHDPDEDVVVRSALLVRDFKRQREALQQEIEGLKIQLTETTLRDGQKIDFLEKQVDQLTLENAEAANNLQVTLAKALDYERVLEKLRGVLDALNIKSPPTPKRVRNGKKNGDNGNQVETAK